ncbi:hypothetical protein L5515_004979 [Caenorhabditis briggsae]|uniref:HTH CENPB-type domain-containing protein n=1 Tax=Caenorhabditis briggsae TaxID=6238 RepID=A0AAE9EJ44_CAEBR|nr:hypothetical protein L5515_004979 [Caenorhabditis briggsae]
MVLNISHVLFLLVQNYPIKIPDAPVVSRQEKKLARVLCSLLDQTKESELTIEETEEVRDEECGDWEAEEFEPYDDFVLPAHDCLRIGDKAVSREDAQAAIDYYRNTTKGSRPLSSMVSRFRWITDAKHMEKLRAFEKEKNEFKENRTNLLRLLSQRLYEIVKEKLETGFSLHVLDLQRFALYINNKETKIQGFKASHSWITSWKSSHRFWYTSCIF